MKAKALATALAATLATSASADMISTDGMAPYEVCGLCHGLDGISAMSKFPKLAGQKAAYIEKQLHDFRAGHRTNDGGQMQAIVTEIEEADIPTIAEWFASQPPPLPSDQAAEPSAAQDFTNLGCAGCHTSPNPPPGLTVPHITAQHPAYLERQLTAFRDGARENDPDGVMRTVTAGLTDAQITALADYIATLPR